MRKLLLGALLSTLWSCSIPGLQNVPPSELAKDEVAIITTADFHASFNKAEGLAGIVRNLRARFGNRAFYFDAGDQFQGSLEGDMSKGKAVVAFFNLIGLDAAAFGNHELDYGPDVPGRTRPRPGENPRGALDARVKEARYQWLSANWIRTGAGACQLQDKNTPRCQNARFNALGQHTVYKPHAVFRRPKTRTVCAIGATTPLTANSTIADYIKGTRYEAPEKVVLAEATFLRTEEKCDLIVLIFHAGLAQGPTAEVPPLLTKLPRGTVDLVVAAHTHFTAQETINGTPVLQAGSNGKWVGVVRLKGPRAALQAHFEPFIPVPDSASQPDVTRTLAPYRQAAATVKSRIVGSATGAFKANYQRENPVTNMIADAIRMAGASVMGATIGFVNAGAVRADLPSGELTFGNIYNTSPHDNNLAVVELKGSELRRLLEISFSGAHGTPGISGLKVRQIDPFASSDPLIFQNPEISRDLDRDGRSESWERNLVLDVTDTAGVPLRDEQSYKIALSDYLAQGADHLKSVFAGLRADKVHVFHGVLLRDVIVDYLRQNPQIDPAAYFSATHRRIEVVSPDSR